MKIVAREIPPRSAWALEQAGVHPLLARLYAARGVSAKEELDDGLARLLAPATLLGTHAAAVLLADAIRDDKRLCIVADYDCDGATACAVAVRGLRLLGECPDLSEEVHAIWSRRGRDHPLVRQFVAAAQGA